MYPPRLGRVRRDLGLESIDPREPPLLSYIGVQRHVHFHAVNVAIIIKDVDLEPALRSLIYGWSSANVCHSTSPYAIPQADGDGVDATRRLQMASERNVRSGKADCSSTRIAMCHDAAD